MASVCITLNLKPSKIYNMGAGNVGNTFLVMSNSTELGIWSNLLFCLGNVNIRYINNNKVGAY